MSSRFEILSLCYREDNCFVFLGSSLILTVDTWTCTISAAHFEPENSLCRNDRDVSNGVEHLTYAAL